MLHPIAKHTDLSLCCMLVNDVDIPVGKGQRFYLKLLDLICLLWGSNFGMNNGCIYLCVCVCMLYSFNKTGSWRKKRYSSPEKLFKLFRNRRFWGTLEVVGKRKWGSSSEAGSLHIKQRESSQTGGEVGHTSVLTCDFAQFEITEL